MLWYVGASTPEKHFVGAPIQLAEEVQVAPSSKLAGVAKALAAWSAALA